MNRITYEEFRKSLTTGELLAFQRNVLANERTLLAYIRTFLSFFVAGVSFINFFQLKWVCLFGYILIPLSFVILILGFMKYNKADKKSTDIGKGKYKKSN